MKKKIGIYLSLLFVLFACFIAFTRSSNALLADEGEDKNPDESLVDTTTYDTYKNIINESRVGRVWTDKSVYNTDINDYDEVVKKEDDEAFLVSLSALSLGIDLNIKEGNVKDIVILQDVTESMGTKVQSSSGNITRFQASKNAINALLEIIAAANDSLSSEDEKFKISLITFAGQNSSTTQVSVLFDLTEIKSSNLVELQTVVTNMKIAKPINTVVSPGLNKAQEQIEKNGRKNVSSSIITFLDGELTTSDDNKAISTANALKQKGIVMFSIIMNNKAKGGTTEKVDKIGQGLSSNYDHATKPGDLGPQTGNTYYYIPKTADDLLESFKDIIKSIQRKNYTISKGTNLTFTDKLGSYMEVKDVKALVYNDEVFLESDKKTEGDVTTYTFTNEVSDNAWITTNTNAIKIRVTKGETPEIGDVIEVSIPYNLVPMSLYDVTSTFLTDSTVYTTTLEEATPISVIYSASVKEEIFNLYRNSDPLILEYVEKYGYIEDYEGFAYFYSNYYKEGDNGTTEVSFTPYSKNEYYYYIDDAYLCTKEGDVYLLYNGDTLTPGTYYTDKEVYKVGEKEPVNYEFERVYDTSKAVRDSNGNWYIEAGTKKRVDSVRVKGNNESKTAINQSSTSWNNLEVKSYLGNNGSFLVHMDVDKISVKVTKVWQDKQNQTGVRPKSVEIKLKRNGEELGDDYTISLTEEEGWTYTYKDLPLIINGEEVTYTIEEVEVDGYVTEIKGDQEEGFIITNTIIIENPDTGFKTTIVTSLILLSLFIYYLRQRQRKKIYKI